MDNSNLPTDNIWYLDVDSKNNIWSIGYEHFLKHDSLWHDYTFYNGSLSCTTPSDIFVAPGDSVWLSWEGICDYTHSIFYDSAPVTNFTWNDYSDPLIYRPAADSQGNLWFNSFSGNGGIVKYSASAPLFYIPFSYNDFPCDHILIDQSNNVWCAGPSQLWKYNQTTWTHFDIPEFIYPSSNVNAMHFDNEGNLWLSFHVNPTGLDFLYEFDGITWTQYDFDNSPFSSLHLTSIKSKSDGSIWFASAKGVVGYYPSGIPTLTSQTHSEGVCSMYPNPVHDELEVDIKGYNFRPVQLIIYDMLHHKVKTQILISNKSRIDVSDISAGIYLAEIHNEDFSISKKLVIQ